MKKYCCFFLVYVLGMIQISLPGGPFLWHIKPDLLLISAVLGGLMFDLKFAVSLAVFAGVMKDILTNAAPHFNVILMGIWGFAAWYAAHKLVLNSHPLRTAIVYIAALLTAFVTGGYGISSGRAIPPGIFARIVITGPFYTALMSPLVWWFMATFCQTGKSRMEEEERVW